MSGPQPPPSPGPQPRSGAAVEWVATPPGGLRPAQRPRRRRPYQGPPAYPAVPRWGFPLLAWRWPLALPVRRRVDPMRRSETLAVASVSLLWITAAVAVLAAGAELWRYALLLVSRTDAVPETELVVSDALVITAGVVTWLLAMTAVVTVALWALRSREAAADRTHLRPARPTWQLLLGLVVPGLNLFVPGSALAELEHTILFAEGERSAHTRPRPSRLVLAWWVAWAVNVVLGSTALLWEFRSGVQAMADGVLLHAYSDVALVVVAVLTARVVTYLTRLLVPVDKAEVPRLRVIALRGVTTPQRVQRPANAVR